MTDADRIPRIPFEDLPPDLADLFRPRVERLGYFGEFFRCAAHQPEALASFYRFTEDLKRALPDRLTELVALTVSTRLDNTYEKHQHERLSLKLGFGEDWVRAVEALAPDRAEGLSEDERRLQRLVLAVVDRSGRETGAERDAVVAALGPKRAMAVLLLIGRYVAHAVMVNCLDLAPPVASPLPDP